MSIDSHLITTVTDINLIEMEESKPLLENREFRKGIFHFYFLNSRISLVGILLGTPMKMLEHIATFRCSELCTRFL